MNVFVVKWPKLASMGYWVASKGNSLFVAKAIRYVIYRLADRMDIKEESQDMLKYLKEMLFIGHGMGGHIAGHVGALLKADANDEKRLGTILVIDAIKFLYSPLDHDRHCVTHHDAFRVLVLHTGDIFLGIIYRLGHEDWFPNGGRIIVPFAGCLSHYRGANLVNDLIRKRPTGYKLLKKNHAYTKNDLAKTEFAEEIEFDFGKVPEADTPIESYPIFIQVNAKQPPYFITETPKKIPAYSVKKKGGAGDQWETIKFNTGVFV